VKVRKFEILSKAGTRNILILGPRGWPDSKKSPPFFPGFAQQTILEVFRRLMRAALVEGVRISVLWWHTVGEVSTEKGIETRV
jgi:hypothetical protein